MERVRWDDAQAFIKKLSEKTGRRYRLPTEAEWEYAARAGSQTSWHFGNDVAHLGRYAWYEENSGGKKHPAGEKLPNQFGLYDVHGNVWEWVDDCWHDNYQTAPKNGSAWVVACSKETARVLRGGSWGYDAVNTRAANRSLDEHDDRFNSVGFRVARNPP